MRVVTLLAYGCPRQAIVKAFGLDERTVARSQQRAGQQCERVHQAVVMQAGLDVIHVQADEIRVKGVQWIAWMALAIMVPTRLWLAGEVQFTRDSDLANRLFLQEPLCFSVSPPPPRKRGRRSKVVPEAVPKRRGRHPKMSLLLAETVR